jgi:hypothetical protein
MVPSLVSRIVSIPHRIFFAGWESTTTELQQCGWRFAAEEDIARYEVRLVLRHAVAGLYGVTESVSHMYFMGRGEPLNFHVIYLGPHFSVNPRSFNMNGGMDLRNFRSIDAYPQMIHVDEVQNVEDFSHLFAVPLVRTEQLIVEPHMVAGLLEKIREAQSPEQAAIRERNRTRDRRAEYQTGVERQVFHAQILSIAS